MLVILLMAAMCAEPKASEGSAADAPLSRDFEYYFKRADDHKAELIEASGDKTREMNLAFSRSSAKAKLKIKVELEFEKTNLADLKRSEAYDWMPTKLRKGDVGRMPECGIIMVLDDETILVTSEKRASWYAVVKVPSTKKLEGIVNGRATPITLDGIWQVESMDGREHAEAAGKPIPASRGNSIAIIEHVDNAVVKQQREAYAASKKKPKASDKK